MEDLAYRRLMDLYYLNERPFNENSTDVAREIGMPENKVEVEYVLGKFFTLIDDLWHQTRIDKEISSFHGKKKQQSDAGIASAKARREKAIQRTFNENSTDVQPNINHKPLTNTKKSKPKKVFSKPTIEEIINYCRERANKVDPHRWLDHYTSNGWKVGKNSMKDWKASVRTWEKNNNGTSSNQRTPSKPDNAATRMHERNKRAYAEATAEEMDGETVREISGDIQPQMDISH